MKKKPGILLISKLGRDLKGLVRRPLVNRLVRMLRGPAHAAGFGALQEFLETGYLTFHRIADVDRFLDEVGRRLTDVFRHIYAAPLPRV